MESHPGCSEQKSFDEIEKQVLEIRQRFGQKLMEATIKNQGMGELPQKKIHSRLSPGLPHAAKRKFLSRPPLSLRDISPCEGERKRKSCWLLSPSKGEMSRSDKGGLDRVKFFFMCFSMRQPCLRGGDVTK